MHHLPTQGRSTSVDGPPAPARRHRLRALATASAAGVLLFAAPSAALADTGDGLGAKKPTTSVPITALPAEANPGLPTSVDLTANAASVGNQGSVGSCVAWAIGHNLMGWYAKKNGADNTDFAPMYMYSQINGGVDNGSSPTEGAELGSAQGIDTHAHYSHPDSDWFDKPNASEIANAAKYKISGWYSLFASVNANPGPNAAVTLKNALASGSPVAITIPVRPGFDNLSTTNTLDTDIDGQSRGLHEVLALGYNEDGLLIENSWGTGWGTNGYGRLSWDVVNNDVYEAIVATGWGSKRTPVINTLGALPQDSGTAESVLGNVNLFDAASATVKIDYGTTSSYGTSWSGSISHTPNSGTNAYGTTLTGLNPGTIYHYKVTITSANGTISSGGDRTFVTAAPPKINSSGAIVQANQKVAVLGNVSLYAAKTATVTVRYGTTTSLGEAQSYDMEKSDTVNTRAFGETLTGLKPATLYHYVIDVKTRYGSATTADRTFTTTAEPVINSFGAINQGENQEVLLGNLSLSTASTGTVKYEWGPTSSYGSTVTETVSHDTSTTNTNAFGTTLTGLTRGTVYHYRITVTSANGTVTTGDQQFVTQAPPKINTIGVLNNKAGHATIAGNIALFTATSGTLTLDWGTTSAYGTTTTSTITHTGTSTNATGTDITGLTPGTTYHYRWTLKTQYGTDTSGDKTFVAGA